MECGDSKEETKIKKSCRYVLVGWNFGIKRVRGRYNFDRFVSSKSFISNSSFHHVFTTSCISLVYDRLVTIEFRLGYVIY